jgi:PASTA domain
MLLLKPSIVVLLGLYAASVTPAQEARNKPIMPQKSAAVSASEERIQRQPQAPVGVPGSQKPVSLPHSMVGRAVPQAPPSQPRIAPNPSQPVVNSNNQTPATSPSIENQTPARKPNILHTIFGRQKKNVAVPPLDGKSLELATRALKDVGLKPKFSGDRGGAVVQQDPAAGQMVNSGSPVSLTMGPLQVVVPSLQGMTEVDARSTLDKAALLLGDVGGNNREGSTVESQSLVAGARVPRDTSVGIMMQAPLPAEGGQPSPDPQPTVGPNQTGQPSPDPQPPAVTDPTLQTTPDPPRHGRPNVTPPTPWWQTAPIALLLAGSMFAGIVTLTLLFRRPPTPTALPAGFSLKVNKGTPRTRLNENNDPKVRFTVSLRDRMAASRYKMEQGPVVLRKR